MKFHPRKTNKNVYIKVICVLLCVCRPYWHKFTTVINLNQCSQSEVQSRTQTNYIVFFLSSFPRVAVPRLCLLIESNKEQNTSRPIIVLSTRLPTQIHHICPLPHTILQGFLFQILKDYFSVSCCTVLILILHMTLFLNSVLSTL
jgi:hypothetical protein